MSKVDALSRHAPVARTGHQAAPRRRGIPDLWHFAAEYLVLLPVGAFVGLTWANTAPESYFRTMFALDFFVNEVAMVLFFGLVMKEIVEATAPGGILHPWRRAALPVVAAGGMTLVSALLFVAIAPFFGEPMVAQGWSVAFATDIAIGYFVALVIFGRHPAVPFFLLLAIAANVLGFVALAPAAMASRMQYVAFVALMAPAIAVAVILRRLRVRTFWPYILVAGGLSWSALLAGGMHAALALVPVIPFLPHAARDPGFFVDAPASADDALNAFERWCRHPAQVALLLFGLISAGVPLRALDWGTVALPLAIAVGKPLGLAAGVAAGILLGLNLPHQVGWRPLTVLACLSTVGFTMALFFATVALGPGPVLSEIKMGVLSTLLGAPAAVVAARVLHVGRFARHGGN